MPVSNCVRLSAREVWNEFISPANHLYGPCEISILNFRTPWPVRCCPQGAEAKMSGQGDYLFGEQARSRAANFLHVDDLGGGQL